MAFLREDGVLVAEQVVGVDLGGEHQFDAGQVARAEVELLVELTAGFDQQGSLASLELVERGAVELGLGLGDLEGVDDGELAVSDLRGDCGAECAHQLLLREGVLIAAGLRSMDSTTATPERGADEPTRARPVPFCFQSFLPAPETSLRFLVAAVP